MSVLTAGSSRALNMNTMLLPGAQAWRVAASVTSADSEEVVNRVIPSRPAPSASQLALATDSERDMGALVENGCGLRWLNRRTESKELGQVKVTRYCWIGFLMKAREPQ